MAARVDWPHLIKLLDVAEEYHGLSDAAAAKQIGLTPSGISRLRRGHALSTDGMAALVAWLYPTSCPSWIVRLPGGEA